MKNGSWKSQCKFLKKLIYNSQTLSYCTSRGSEIISNFCFKTVYVKIRFVFGGKETTLWNLDAFVILSANA